jgi:hypothetical protein
VTDVQGVSVGKYFRKIRLHFEWLRIVGEPVPLEDRLKVAPQGRLADVPVVHGVVQEERYPRRIDEVVPRPVRSSNIGGIVGDHVLVVVHPGVGYLPLFRI